MFIKAREIGWWSSAYHIWSWPELNFQHQIWSTEMTRLIIQSRGRFKFQDLLEWLSSPQKYKQAKTLLLWLLIWETGRIQYMVLWNTQESFFNQLVGKEQINIVWEIWDNIVISILSDWVNRKWVNHKESVIIILFYYISRI